MLVVAAMLATISGVLTGTILPHDLAIIALLFAVLVELAQEK